MRLCFGLAFAILFTGNVYGTAKDGTSNSAEIVLSSDEVTYNEEDNIVRLNDINYFKSQGAAVDISLSRESYDEECYVRPPSGELINVDTIAIEGVDVHDKSKYVSCRITIGPLTEEFLGIWELCGKSVTTNETRCRPVSITFNTGSGILIAPPTIQPRFTHPVHFSGSVNSGVIGTGTVTTCHIITPAGEDLAITSDMEYPHIEIASTSLLCGVIIKDITEDMLGDWMIYGIFRSSILQSETRLPLTFDLYNKEDPYDQAYNVTQSREEHIVYLGTSLTREVTHRTGNVEDCIYVTPSGQRVSINTDQANALEGVSFNNSVTEAVCQITINPITNENTGEWQLIGKFKNGVFFDETRLTFTIIEEDPRNPIEDGVDRNIVYLNDEDVLTSINAQHAFVIDTATLYQRESCHLRTPDGLQYSLIDGFNVPNVEIVNENRVECGVMVTVASADMAGEWVLMARSNYANTIPYERRLRFTIRIAATSDDENITLLGPINHFTRQNAMIDITLNKEEFEEECFVRSPTDDMISADLINMAGVQVHGKSEFVSCRITVGPMTQNLIGVWRLCGRSVIDGETRCRPVDIAWNGNNGAGTWDINTQARFTHPVHFRGSVNTGVSTSSSLTSCHVITPAGEDLVITTDVQYPHIERSTLTNSFLCSVVIKDITADMIGDWVVYGVFRSTWWQSEVRRPLTFTLYNEDNPYEQAYNVTNLQEQQHLVHLGTDLTLEVRQRTGVVEDCIYIAPSGQTYSINNSPSNIPAGVSFISSDTEAVCQIVFNPITNEVVGQWQMSGKFRNGILFDESRLTFSVIEEDPENPIEEDINRVVEYITSQNITTEMNSAHRITIITAAFAENESCHLRTPEGLQYAFINGFNVPNVEIINESGVECGIILEVATENMIGEWTLIARSNRLSTPIERRLPFTIRVEDNFVLQNDILIKEGADLYLHLNDAISMPDTCMLYGPNGEEFTEVETDPIYTAACGYVVRGVDSSHNGTWIIEYGDRIKRRGRVNVQVLDSYEISLDNIRWIVGDSIDIPMGPENAVYCIIKNPYGHTVFDDFGQCNIVLDRVTVDHAGTWKMSVGLPGTVHLQEHGFYVAVHARDGPLVTTTVEKNAPAVILTCSVPVEHEVNACKFRDPHGNILVAAYGVGQDGYMFNGSMVNYESEAHSHDCSLRLSDPTALDLGIWRCAMDTNTGTYYGFLTVVCPHLMQDPDVAASVVTEPVLQNSSLSYLEGDAVTMSCSISTQLRYCYFRARNGSVYNVFPSMATSENFEYVGAGLDAGECGIRFKKFSANEGGLWSCHVGLVDTAADELRADVNVNVTAKMVARHYWDHSERLVVEAHVYNEHALDYCRFVRMNGQGFTSDNLPDGYEIEQTLHKGICTLYIRDPNIINLHPWTIAAKLVGLEGEISTTTTEILLLPQIPSINIGGEILFWSLIAIMCLIPIIAGSVLIPKKNREWTYRRASKISKSFRRSFKSAFAKKASPQVQPNEISNEITKP